MSKHMRRNGLGNPGSNGTILEDFPKTLPGHRSTQPGQKQCRRRSLINKGWTSELQIVRNQFTCLIADGYDSLLVTLAGGLKKSHFQIEIPHLQLNQLRNTKARGLYRLRPYAGS